MASPPPTPSPTPLPTFKPTALLESVHPVKIIFKNLPSSYRFSDQVRASLLRLVRRLIEDNLNDELELVEIVYADGVLPQDQRRGLRAASRRLSTFFLPLLVTVRGPADVTDFAFQYIMEVMRDHLRDIADFLRTVNESGNAFVDYGISDLQVGGYMVNELVTEGSITTSSSESETSSSTSSSKTSTSSSTSVGVLNASTSSDTENNGVPWWVWLVVTAFILTFCICFICMCMYVRRKEDEKELKQGQNAVINQYLRESHVSKQYNNPPRRRRKKSVRREEHESNRRYSLRTVRPVVKRMISQTEIEELERDRMYAHQKQERQMNQPDPKEERNLQLVPVSTDSIASSEHVGIDPPEENALMIFNPEEQYSHPDSNVLLLANYAHADPEGMKVPKKRSMYASDVYYSGMTNGEDPYGKKAPKKDSVFVCPINEIPEDIRRSKKGRKELKEKKSRKSKKGTMDKLKRTLSLHKEEADEDGSNESPSLLTEDGGWVQENKRTPQPMRSTRPKASTRQSNEQAFSCFSRHLSWRSGGPSMAEESHDDESSDA